MSIKSSIASAAILALISTSGVQASANDPAPHTPIPPIVAAGTCNMNSGPENVSIGGLYYAREVLNDAIIKYEQYQQDKLATSRNSVAITLQDIETRNDYLCDLPVAYQGTLEFLVTNLLIWVIDIIQN